jgi:protein-disulfide isomerase
MQEVTIKINKTTLFTAAGLLIGLCGGYALGAWNGNNNSPGIFAKNNQPAAQQPTNQTGDNQPAANPTVKISLTAADHITGGKNPQVYLVEYSDFQCPYCKRHEPTIQQVLKTYGGKVAVVYRHYPLSFHQNAQIAAEASECASEQGKFWQYHDVLFDKGQGDGTGLASADLKKYAVDLGLNTAKFNTCLDANKYSAVISADQASGNSYGVNGTPATFVTDTNGNGELVSGAVPFETMKAAIDAKLK